MEHIHRVVRRLVQPMQDANVSSRLNGSGHQRIREQGVVDGLAAGEGEQKTAWLHALQGTQIDALVTLNSGMPCRSPLGKSRRIQHHDVVVAEFV